MIGSKQLIMYFKAQIDILRTTPNTVKVFLEQRLLRFNDKKQYSHSLIPNIHYRTTEGEEGVKQAIEYLQNIPSLPKLVLSSALCEAAFIMIQKMASVKELITSLDIYADQIEKHVMEQVQQCSGISAIVDYGFRLDPEIIPSLVVDDGCFQRGKRKTVLGKEIQFIGIGVFQHSQFDYIVLFIFAKNVVERKSECQCIVM